MNPFFQILPDRMDRINDVQSVFFLSFKILFKRLTILAINKGSYPLVFAVNFQDYIVHMDQLSS